MRAHTITKAAILGIGAVLAAVLVIGSVPDVMLTANESGFHPVATAAKAVPTKSKQKRASILVASTLKPSATKPSTLLAIVNQPTIHEDQKVIADAVLRRLPSGCRDNLKNFFVLYDAKQRGLGGKSTIIIDGSVGDAEFAALLTHECGHVIHGNLVGNLTSGKSAFKDGKDTFAKDSAAASFFSISWMTENVMKEKTNKTDFVTGYAQTNAFEDFAETFAFYVLQRPAMEARAKTNSAMKAKLDWMKTNLPIAENTLGTAQYSWDNKLPWDATRLAYVWNPISL